MRTFYLSAMIGVFAWLFIGIFIVNVLAQAYFPIIIMIAPLLVLILTGLTYKRLIKSGHGLV